MFNNFEQLKANLPEYEGIIGYTFRDKSNAVLSLTHSSYANENRGEKLKSNERLEFLGDAVLNIVISEKIYKEYTGLAEGELTKSRANIVCESSLVKCAQKLQLGRFLLLGKGEELTGGRNRVSILSDAFEALIGAIYIDGGMERARSFIHTQMDRLVEDAMKGNILLDYKSQLQEMVQKDGDRKITYEIIDEKGPDHDKLFVSQVRVADEAMGQGEGKSKKEAEQNAAKAAMGKFL